MTRETSAANTAVRLWLIAVALLVFCMVIVGGATRLTDSGLSITEWQPLLGAIPPLTEAHWLEAFAKYKQIPEYQIQNRGMSLDDFKFIYWWEWAHRFLGRIIGLVFIVPLIVFVALRRIERRLYLRLFVLFLLGGLQGALGWYMVSSGLSERVDVSQYRLAAHLTLAVALFAALVWTLFGLNTRRHWRSSPEAWLAGVFLAVLFAQVAMGGFVAGLDAGHASDTWPLMQGRWVPDGMWSISPWWRNVFENALTAQFLHRLMAYAILLLSLMILWRAPSHSAMLLLAVVLAQASLGIMTVLWHVPLFAALMHQGGALVVIALALWHLHLLLVRPGPAPDRQ